MTAGWCDAWWWSRAEPDPRAAWGDAGYGIGSMLFTILSNPAAWFLIVSSDARGETMNTRPAPPIPAIATLWHR